MIQTIFRKVKAYQYVVINLKPIVYHIVKNTNQETKPTDRSNLLKNIFIILDILKIIITSI